MGRGRKPAVTQDMREDKAWNAVEMLGCSYEEAMEMVLTDEAIDRNEQMPWSMTKEELKESRKVRAAQHGPSTTPTNRKTETPQDKMKLFEILMDSVPAEDDSINILTAGREFEFYFNNTKYRVTLASPRK